MGKAKRAKLKRAEEQERIDRINAQKRAERRDTMKVTLVAVSILLAVAIVVTACCLAVLSIKGTGNYLRKRVGVSSANYEVNNAMMSYFFHDTIASTVSNAVSQYGSYAVTYGIIPDTSMALRDQKNSSGKTWYAYFMENTVESVESMLILAEAAKAEGVTLSDIENSRIDQAITVLDESAKEAGVSTEKFIHENYGLGVKADDIREALKIYFLGQKFYYETLGKIEVTDAEIKAHYDKNADDYDVVDYKVYTFVLDTKDKDAKSPIELSKKLLEAKTPEEFDSILKDLIKDKYDDEKKLNEAIDGTLRENASLVEKSEYSKWLFDDDRKVGDTKSFTADNGNVSVYMLVNASHRNESETKDVRHILFAFDGYDSKEECKAEAERILAEYKAVGSVEKFAELAARYSTDSGSSAYGGLYENVAKNVMVEEFEDWIFDDSRKAGDVDIIETAYGYHIMYFVGEGRPEWEASIFDELRSEKYSDMAEDFTEKYPVTIDSKKLENIPDIH